MKKLFFLFLSICMILTSCATVMTNGNNNDDTENTVESNTELTEPGFEKKPNIFHSDCSGINYSVTFEIYDDYLYFIETRNVPSEYSQIYDEQYPALPDNFVTYEMIKKLGSFVAYEETEAVYVSYIMFTYVVKDTNDCQLLLDMRYQDFKEFPPEEFLDLNLNGDMRTLETRDSGYYCIGNIVYRYNAGRLSSISWMHNGVQFWLSPSRRPELCDYPLDGEDTIASRLLNSETAAAALEELYSTAEGEE